MPSCYKVTHTGAGHKETFKPPDVFLLGSNKADVLDFARLCVIYFGFAIKKLYIYHVFAHFVLVVSRESFFQVPINQITFETLQVTDASPYRFRIKCGRETVFLIC